MRKLFQIIILLLLLSSAFRAHGQNIRSISFEGLTKTKPEFLKGIIKSKEGQVFNDTLLQEDIATIRNLNLFFFADGKVEHIEGSEELAIIFEIKEAFYFYPIVNASGFKSQFKLELGFNHINFLGKAQSLGALYKFYDRHSFSVFYNANRHQNGKTGHELALTKYSTIEPLYFTDTVSDFNFDNYNISAGGHYWITNRLRVGLGGMYMYETYRQLDTAAFDLGATQFNFHKYQFRTFADLNLLNYHFERLEGIRNYIYFETVQTVSYPEISFFKFTNDIYWFLHAGERGNFALHNRLGIATNNDSPFAPFVLDGFINVRGIGNRVSRGTAEFIVNAEFRYTVWRHKWFMIQLIALSDLGTLRQPGDKIEDMFNYKALNLFAGGGFRIHSRVLYNTCFRLDYSVNPIHPNQHGLTFGFEQFF